MKRCGRLRLLGWMHWVRTSMFSMWEYTGMYVLSPVGGEQELLNLLRCSEVDAVNRDFFSTNSFPRSNTRRSSLHSLLTETTWAACTCFKSCSARVRSSMGDNLTRTCDAFSSSKFSKAETSGSHSLIAIVLPPCPSRRAGSINIQSTDSIICR